MSTATGYKIVGVIGAGFMGGAGSVLIVANDYDLWEFAGIMLVYVGAVWWCSAYDLAEKEQEETP